MNLKLIHHQSATVTIESDGVKILSDPWLIDGAYYGSWEQYPPYDFKAEKFDDVDYIYISHIHPDHCNNSTLSKLRKDIPVLIHNYPGGILKGKIENLGFEVKELPHNKRIHLKKNMFINISAADNCDPAICGKFFGCNMEQSENTNPSTNQIDTMCVIDNNKEVVVNTNDCPFEMANYIASKIKNLYQNIDLLLLAYSGASAYPHCYDLPLQEKLIEASKKKEFRLGGATKYINLFKPKFFMPFAGRYTLGGKLHELNIHRGEPELEEAFDELTTRIEQKKHRGILLNSDSSFDITTGTQSKPYQRINIEEKSKYVKEVLSKYKFDYENDPIVTEKQIEELLPASHKNFEEHRKKYGFKSDTTILIKITENKFIAISCNGKGYKIILKDEIEKYEKINLLSLDIKLLYRILLGPKKAVWDNADIGSHIRFKRVPNIYELGLYYSLTHFHS